MQPEFAEFTCSRAFYDNKHYPHGFSRSGDFTLKEAQGLTRYGVLLNNLMEGRLVPANEHQSHFIQVMRGEAEAEHPLEKLWLKYLDKVRRPIVRYSCSTASSDGGDFVSDEAVGEY